jgi:hypothetical protein
VSTVGSAAVPDCGTEPAPNFEGHAVRECGEHRTVGPHRAWCHDCGEWCYPGQDGGCKGCRLGALATPLTQELAPSGWIVAAAGDKRFESTWVGDIYRTQDSAADEMEAARSEGRELQLYALYRCPDRIEGTR